MDAIDGVVPRVTVRPDDVAGVQAVVRDHPDGIIVASGLGAHLEVGNPPDRVDVCLRTDALDRVLDHQAADMTVTVEAGCSLARLDETLAWAGQWLPLDPPSFDGTTVGGLVAANLSGPLRASQGTVRDLLLGLRVVDADGAVVSGGGRVVKNVAGYDLPKLHVGALGTLGVVVQATFKVRPRPEREAAAVLPTATHAEAWAIALDVRAALDPFWLEAGSLGDGIGAAVGIAGSPAEIAAARSTIEEIGRRRTVEVRRIDDGSTLRRALGAFAVAPAAAVLRVSVLPTDVAATTAWIHDLAGDVPILAHVANGVVRARLADAGAVPRIVSQLRSELVPRGGFVVVERAAPDVKAGLDVWGDPGEGLALMRRVKAAFDPRGVFARGRYVARM